MTRLPQIAMLPDGKRLHLQDGPIDLVIEATGNARAVALAYDAAVEALTGLLDTLCSELPDLRREAQPLATSLQGRVAQRMYDAVAPFASETFITPMAAVAGAVAEEVLAAMIAVAPLDRAYVNNGGDVALHLSLGQVFDVGLVDRPNQPTLLGKTRVDHISPVRGIATSGWRGRSFSLGIADAITVLARTAAQADAAATIVANAVDLPGHPAIVKVAANELQPDSDLGSRLVTRDVGSLLVDEINAALGLGEAQARDLLARGLIEGAALHLQGTTRVVALNDLNPAPAMRTPELLYA